MLSPSDPGKLDRCAFENLIPARDVQSRSEHSVGGHGEPQVISRWVGQPEGRAGKGSNATSGRYHQEQ